MTEWTSRERWLLAAILGIGLLLRLTYLLEILRAPDFAAPQFEAQYHDYWARALLTGDWTPPDGVTDPEIPQRPYFRPPGYPWFLAAIYALAGPSYLWPRVLQMLLGLASCLLLHRLARRTYGRLTALFAAALAAVYWLFIFFEGELMAVGLLVFLLLATLTLAARWSDALTLRCALGTGVLLGATALVRPNAAALVPVLVLWAAWLARRRGGPSAWRGKTFLRPTLGFLAAFALTTLPATLRNWAVAEDPVWITSNAGVNLFVGTHLDSDGHSAGVRELGEISGLERGWDSFDYPLIAAGVERLQGRSLKDSEVSAYFARRALGHALSEPLAVLRLVIRKLALFWGPAEISNNKVIHFERISSPTLRFSPGFATVLALALAGVLLLFWQRRLSGVGIPASEAEKNDTGTGSRATADLSKPESSAAGPRDRQLEISVLLLAVVAAYCASFLPFFVSARFRAPVIPLLIVFAGYALAALWRALAALRLRRLAAVAATIVALRGLTGIAWIPYEPDLALWHWRKGLLWQARGDADRAREAFHKAIAADPDDAEARLSLAESLAAAGQLDAAIDAYRATLALDPGSIAAHNNLARLLVGRGDRDAAIHHWNAALELDPNRLSVLNNLAFALAGRAASDSDTARAVELAERAVEQTDRADPRLLATLAIAYRAAGRAGDAERARQQAEALARSASPERSE